MARTVARVLVTSVVCALQRASASAQCGVLLTDTFDVNSLDPARSQVVLPFGNSGIRQPVHGWRGVLRAGMVP